MAEVAYTYRTWMVGITHEGYHHTRDLDEAKHVSSTGIIERKPTGDWEVVPDA